MTIQLPPELVVDVVDRLAEHPGDLKTCSLLCRAWLSRPRFHLFGTCTLLPQNIVKFPDILRSPVCTFLNQVHTVKATRYYWHQNESVFNEIATDLRRLTNVRVLELTLSVVLKADHSAADHFFRSGFITSFPQVTHLVLDCKFDGQQSAPLIDTICFFPALQKLRISTTGTLADPPAAMVPPVGLRVVELMGSAPGPILAWLTAFEKPPGLHSLKLFVARSFQLRAVLSALQRLAGSIHDLELTLAFKFEGYNAKHIAVFGLTHHPNLKTLTIRDVSWDHPSSFDHNEMMLLISRLDAPTLESMSFDLHAPLYRDFNWATLDAFLCSARFPCLRRVVLVDYAGHDALGSFGGLPMLEASGVLRKAK